VNFKFQISNFKILGIAYIIGIIALCLYSFTQVDLGLTLTRASFFQTIQTSFQYIGYFNRPLSTYIYIGIVCYLFFFYLYILAKYQSFSIRQIWTVVIISSLILLFSYSAFSYDIFNYIFDARIWTTYGKNPYEFKALDFPNDSMLAFMHWTHRVYPYGPVWLFITIPVSYIGFGYFLLTYFLFKVIMVSCFLATVWFIQKILYLIAPKNVLFGLVFFALNPFVLIESLVSSHNDIVMLFFFICGLYFFVKKRYIFTFISLVLGYGIKFASAAYPLIIHSISIIVLGAGIGIGAYIQKKVKLRWEIFFMICTMLMIIPVVFASLRTNFQPWYFLSLMPFAALSGKKFYIFIPIIIMSFIILFEYVPYLYLGNWNNPVPFILQMITISGIILAITTTVVIAGYKKLLRS
jgi:hypothetical protein